MNAKVVAAVVVLAVVAVGIFLAIKPTSKSAPPVKEKPAQTAPVEPAKTLSAEQAYRDFLKWKKETSPTPDAMDKRLEVAAAQFPADYRFSLERIRGAANIKGAHSHAEEFEILKEAAKKAIACQCGASENMRNDLLANKDQKNQGFWKLSTHPKQWNAVIEALEQENAALLDKGEHHH